MDMTAWLWVCVAIGLIPSLIASFVYCTQRFSKPSESVDELTKIGGVEVSLIDLRRSQMHLRWVITYTCMQLGWMVSVMSVAPILGWGLGLYGWRAVANAFIAATTYLAFTPLGLCLILLGIFPRDGRKTTVALCLLLMINLLCAFGVIVTLANPHTSNRPTLLVMNVLVLLVLLVVIILLLPALSDKIRCGPHRPGPISEIFFPQAELSSQQRLARGWLCIRLCFNTLGVLYILFSILRAFSDVDRWSKISTTHGDFASYIILGCSLLFHGIVFAPCFRSRSARCLGRRARPAPSDKLAAQLSGFDNFYDIGSATSGAASAASPV